ncbi:Uncharacterized protein FKW44_018856 [Caligus rogercresseyi]|uniref:Mos1 transposase HTH domain-containing protein n=1 Tax=Caligus rogercresseyi TaxID=217165 RepID=A0A7T8GV25_CALRO|nr:Uncharacterized protein FKW44_018856 [Caligus rogercresseyi]
MDTPDTRSYFLIRIKLPKTVNEIHGDLISTFPDSCPGLSTIKRWRKDFNNGSFDLENNTSSGRPRETKTPETIATVKYVIEDNHSTDCHQGFSTTENRSRLLTEDLGLRKVLSVDVPQQLYETNKRILWTF